MTDPKSMLPGELEQFFADLGEKPFRARQVFAWMHQKSAASFDEMTDLSRLLRERLKKEAVLTVLEPVQVLTSQLDGTKKFLFRLPDGNVVESVLMYYRHGCSVCISSQVGCRMGCVFCASTIGGRIRNLSAAEMLEQVYRIQAFCGQRISNVVVMGTGEPLDNYENLVRFIRLLSCEEGKNLSQRSITVSTCGLVPEIKSLAEEHFSITLALSLHAVTQEKREALMPIAKKYELEQVLEACRLYFARTGRRVTLEYSLVARKNDTMSDAAGLIRIARGMNCHVNLIPVNPVAGKSFTRPDKSAVLRFKNNLEKSGINVTIRREMGTDINGACGQLRRSYLEKTPPGASTGSVRQGFGAELEENRKGRA